MSSRSIPAGRRTLYKAREPIYPKRVKGTFRRLKWAILIATLSVYYFIPWIRWPRGVNEPAQAVLVDFPGRRFYFFFIEIWPSELYFVTGLLIIAALMLFLMTALFGRVWCGYTCPQTVWTDLFIGVERLVEGDRNKRMRLAKAPWTASKIAKKTVKHTLWILIAAATGGAWVFYFHDAPTVFPEIFTGDAPGTAYLFMGILTFTTYMLAGTMREQVCTYMCPWPRIQGALIDEEALNVTYRKDRGEPRGAHKKGEPWDGRGDCVDCQACVGACPMGIDIRDGAQLECINCALCIDACNTVMDKVERPRGLIAYDTDLNFSRRAEGKPASIRLVRPRTVMYASLILIVSSIMTVGLVSRPSLTVDVSRDRAPAFVRLSDGSVRNAYKVQIYNKSNVERGFTISFAGLEGAEIGAVGVPVTDGRIEIVIPGDGARSLRVFATLPASALTAPSMPLEVRATARDNDEMQSERSVFLSERH